MMMTRGRPGLGRGRFDDERVVSDAGIMLVATLAERLGIERLVGGGAVAAGSAGGGERGRKVMALVYAMLLALTAIDDCEVLRAGRTRRVLGGWVPAPSTWGRSCARSPSGMSASSTSVAETLVGAWRAGAGPGDRRLVIDMDSFIGEVHGYKKQGAGFGYTKQRGYHPLVASRADTGEVLHIRLRKGKANSSAVCRGSLMSCSLAFGARARAARSCSGPTPRFGTTSCSSDCEGRAGVLDRRQLPARRPRADR